MRIGFLGLGNMGAPIAANLARAGHDVSIWNRTADKARSLVDAGATLVANPKAVASRSDVVFTMLADDAALDSVLGGENGALAGLKPGGLHVSMSTIAVATAERIAALHRALGQRFLCAPVFGRPEAAAAAKLFVVAAGDPADLQTATPLLETISQRVFYLGETPSSASLVKLAEKGGVAETQLLEVLTGTLFDSPVYRTYGAIIAAERFRPAGFAAPLGLKDMRLVGQSADALRVPMPLLSLLRDHLLQTIAQEGEDMDWSAIALAVKKNAGLS